MTSIISLFLYRLVRYQWRHIWTHCRSPFRRIRMSKSIEARLDAIESRFAIDALIANYAEAFDTMNMELLASLWHPDARLLLGANGNSDGLEAILSQAQVNMKRMPHMHHWMANALITVDGDNG